MTATPDAMDAPITLYVGSAAAYALEGVWYQLTAARFARPAQCSPWMDERRRAERLDQQSEECLRRSRVNFRRAKRSVQRGLHGGIIY